jgi:PAS domain S-box-containing protein
MNIDHLTAVDKVIGITIAISGVIVGSYKYIKRMLFMMSQDRALLQSVAEKIDQITPIYDEVVGKNGSSISSVVGRIEARQIFQEQSTKALMNSLNVGYWHADADGRATDCSRTLCRILERASDELLGLNWTLWLHPEDRDRVNNAWAFSVEKSTEFCEEYRFLQPDGGIVKVKGVAYPLYGHGNGLTGFFGTITRVNTTEADGTVH